MNVVMTIKIILADDHKILREGLKQLLSKESGFEVIGEAQDGRTAVQLAKKLSPDVMIMDIGMPDLNGIEATRQIKSVKPDIKIITLSMHEDRRFIKEMFKAGATGYLLKDMAFENLVKAIQSVMNNQIYLCPKLSDLFLNEFIRTPSTDLPTVFSELTPREREVLQFIAEGRSTKEIAGKLQVSVKTIETHRLQIMGKLDMHNIADLTKYAIREGLTDLN